jgi:hypothetical protein
MEQEQKQEDLMIISRCEWKGWAEQISLAGFTRSPPGRMGDSLMTKISKRISWLHFINESVLMRSIPEKNSCSWPKVFMTMVHTSHGEIVEWVCGLICSSPHKTNHWPLYGPIHHDLKQMESGKEFLPIQHCLLRYLLPSSIITTPIGTLHLKQSEGKSDSLYNILPFPLT